MRTMFSIGRSDEDLLQVLYATLGTDALPPAHSESFVESLVVRSAQQGSADRGEHLEGTEHHHHDQTVCKCR